MPTLTDYQGCLVERSFTFGRGTNYPGVGGTKGVIGLPPVRDHDIEFQLRHGAQAGVDVYGQRTIQVPLQVIADDEDTLAARIQALQAAWQPSSTDIELQLKLAGTQLSYFGRCRGLLGDAIGTRGLIGGHALLVGVFVAGSPFAYSDLTVVAADASSPVVITNAGNAVSRRCILSVLGNGGVPSITNVTDPHAGDITFTRSLGVGVTCGIDLDAQTAHNGLTNLIDHISIGSLWTDLQPGPNALTFTGCASVAATFRSAFQGN